MESVAPPSSPGVKARLSLTSGPAIVAYLALVKLVIHLATAKVYGFFIDELYFLACGKHLAWGYVDMQPLTALQAWFAQFVLGGSAYAIRLLPALAGAGLVLLTGKIVRELGGGRWAQTFAALCVLVAPDYLAFSSYLSMNSIEPLLWMGCALILIRLIKNGNPKLWLGFGVVAGIGLENKLTMLMYGFALVAGLCVTKERRHLWNRWLLLGGSIAFLIFLPNLLWMIRHHFPLLELLANIKRDGRDVIFTPTQFLWMQILFMQPLAFPVWFLGLWQLLFSRSWKHFRVLGMAFVISFIILLTTHGKVYYLCPAYPVLFAVGAITLEMWATQYRLHKWGLAYAGLLVLLSVLYAPTLFPVLPPETYLHYTAALHIAQPRLEHRATNALPQFFADRMGWPEMVRTVANIYNSLPPDERARTAIFGNDYGQCGAIDYYGAKYGLPPSIGNHLNYWYWGPRQYTGESVIVLGDDREGVDRHFEDVKEVGVVGNPYSMRQEHYTIYLCHRPKGWTFKEVWPRLKNWN